MIAVTEVHVPEEAEVLVLDCLRSGGLAQGPKVAQLESEFAEMCGVDHAVAVGNGTLALELALAVADLSPGDEVLTTPFTFVATINAALAAGARASPAAEKAVPARTTLTAVFGAEVTVAVRWRPV